MFAGLAKSIFGSANDRYVRGLGKYVDAVNNLESSVVAFSDEQLRGQTELFRQRLANGEKLDNLLPEAFATVREAAKRTLGQRHYDVQLIGGIALQLRDACQRLGVRRLAEQQRQQAVFRGAQLIDLVDFRFR